MKAARASRKMISSCLAGVLLVSLSACSSSPSSMQREENPANTPQSTISECTAATENGFYRSDIYFPGGANISYVDFSSRQELFLCNNPNCTHDSESCISYYPFDGKTQLSGVLTVGDHLLAFQEVPSESALPHIDLLALNGTFERRIAEFKANQKLPPTAMDGSYFTDQENLYFVLTDTDSETAKTALSLLQLDLETGNLKTLYQAPSNSEGLNICAAYDRSLVLDEIDAELNYSVFSLNVDTSEKTPTDFSFENGRGVSFDGHYACDIDSLQSTGTLIDLTTGSKTPFDFSALTDQVTDEYGSIINIYASPLNFTKDFCIIEYFIKDAKEGSQNRLDYVFSFDYVFNFQTGETTLFNLYKPFNKDIMQVEAQYNGLLFIQTDWKVQNTKLDELYIPSWMLISPEDYLHSNLNGQEFTLLPLENG